MTDDHSIRMPFDDAAPGTTLDLSDALLSGGLVVLAVKIPTDDGGHLPGVAFRFAKPDGSGFHQPILFACDDPDHLDEVAPLIAEAVAKAKAQ